MEGFYVIGDAVDIAYQSLNHHRIDLPSPLLADPETRKSISVADFEAAFAHSHPSITYGVQRVVTRKTVSAMGVQIFIKMLTGKTETLDADLSDMVEDVEEEIEYISGIPHGKQRLIYAGMQLEDGRTLAQCKVWEQSTLHLVLRLTGD